jgi:hypothetical protein
MEISYVNQKGFTMSVKSRMTCLTTKRVVQFTATNIKWLASSPSRKPVRCCGSQAGGVKQIGAVTFVWLAAQVGAMEGIEDGNEVGK